MDGTRSHDNSATCAAALGHAAAAASTTTGRRARRGVETGGISAGRVTRSDGLLHAI